jgi:hypothetical protein
MGAGLLALLSLTPYIISLLAPTIMIRIDEQEICSKLLLYLRRGFPMMLATRFAGISARTLSQWRKLSLESESYYKMIERINEAQAQFCTEMYQLVHKLAQKDFKAAKWLLTKAFPSELDKQSTFVQFEQPIEGTLIDNTATLADSILVQLSAGEISVEDARVALSTIEESRKVAETLQVKERIDSIQKTIAKASTPE